MAPHKESRIFGRGRVQRHSARNRTVLGPQRNNETAIHWSAITATKQGGRVPLTISFILPSREKDKKRVPGRGWMRDMS